MRKVLSFALFTMILSCAQSTQNEEEIFVENDSVKTTEPIKEEETREERYLRLAEKDRLDSIALELAYQDAFKIATNQFEGEKFSEKYDFFPADSSSRVGIEIIIDNLFEDGKKYFLLRRQTTYATFLDLFKIKDGQANKMIERMQDDMTYIRDTIFDVNGDGYMDFLVQWHPSAGCCVALGYNVYLNQPKQGKFTSDYEFINPTFSAKEKMIRGIEYGYSCEVGLYKYKWNGLRIDTIEYIYLDPSEKGQFIKTKKASNNPTIEEGVQLKEVPKEYHTIESIDRFMGC